jgi:Protein of unknown function (DUF2846)
MNIRNWLAVVCASVLMASACSYTILGPPYHPAPVAANTSVIYLYRPNIRKGSAHAMSVFVDGLPVGFFFPGGYVPFHVRPGNHTVGIIVSGKTQTELVDAEPDGDYYFRYDVSFGGTKLTPVPREVGRSEVTGCNLLPGGYDARDRI